MYKLYFDPSDSINRPYIVIGPDRKYRGWRDSAEEAIDTYIKYSTVLEGAKMYQIREGYKVPYPCIATSDTLDELRVSAMLRGH